MPPLDRRRFLSRAVRYGGGALAGFSALQALLDLSALSNRRLHRAGRGEGGYGPLLPAGEDLALPAGFQYLRFGDTGFLMDDGVPSPPAPDGMGAIPLPRRGHPVGQLAEL